MTADQFPHTFTELEMIRLLDHANVKMIVGPKEGQVLAIPLKDKTTIAYRWDGELWVRDTSDEVKARIVTAKVTGSG